METGGENISDKRQPPARPTGLALFWISGITMLLAVFLWLIASSMEVARFGQIDAERLASQSRMFAVAGMAAPISIASLMCGFIVRAIWFLPGRKIDDDATGGEKEGGDRFVHIVFLSVAAIVACAVIMFVMIA